MQFNSVEDAVTYLERRVIKQDKQIKSLQDTIYHLLLSISEKDKSENMRAIFDEYVSSCEKANK
jgi:hypothetical protein